MDWNSSYCFCVFLSIRPPFLFKFWHSLWSLLKWWLLSLYFLWYMLCKAKLHLWSYWRGIETSTSWKNMYLTSWSYVREVKISWCQWIVVVKKNFLVFVPSILKIVGWHLDLRITIALVLDDGIVLGFYVHLTFVIFIFLGMRKRLDMIGLSIFLCVLTFIKNHT